MTYIQISKMPTTLCRSELINYYDNGSAGAHESLLRAYHIVAQVKRLLQINTPPEVVLELIDLMETKEERP